MTQEVKYAHTVEEHFKIVFVIDGVAESFHIFVLQMHRTEILDNSRVHRYIDT